MALDLHVLGLPPAFVLSQDQTLKLKRSYLRVLDVEPLHIVPLFKWDSLYRLVYASVSKETKAAKQ